MSQTKFSVPRGTSDILPAQAVAWQELEAKARALFGVYCYKEIRTPIFEETALFARSMGQASDIVEKQMLSLQKNTREGESGESKKNYSLRPEGTASIVRSYIENNLDKIEHLSKLFYIGPMFRGERPQKGRLRQFHQVGAEAIGPKSASPFLDAEIISLCIDLIRHFGITDYVLKLNTLGSPEDKKQFAKLLRHQLKNKKSCLCPTCQDRFERNVFRVLDCKNKECQGIVHGLDMAGEHLSKDNLNYYTQVKQALDSMNIKYQETPTLVRGLDYYTQTVFEITSPALGSQDALGAGGRYSQLVCELGGSADVDAVGFSLGIERILLALGPKDKAEEKSLDVFIVSFDEQCFLKAFDLLYGLRQENISTDMDYRCGSIKSQMKAADKACARYVIIIGQEELEQEVVTIKNMQTGEQKQTALIDAIQMIKEILEVQ